MVTGAINEEYTKLCSWSLQTQVTSTLRCPILSLQRPFSRRRIIRADSRQVSLIYLYNGVMTKFTSRSDSRIYNGRAQSGWSSCSTVAEPSAQVVWCFAESQRMKKLLYAPSAVIDPFIYTTNAFDWHTMSVGLAYHIQVYYDSVHFRHFGWANV